MNRIRTRLLAGLLAALLLFSLFGCAAQQEELTEVSELSTTAPATTKKKKTKKTDYNRLTGLDNLSKEGKGKRPVAVMINNIRASLPQYGIFGADLMFECLVEGGITRMMAVFADQTKIPKVMSVRSCRYYFPIFAQGLDAVYICFGCNPTLGKKALKDTKIDYFDGSENFDTDFVGRDPERLKSYSKEHTAFLKGDKVPDLIKKYNMRAKYKKSKDNYIFDFRDPAPLDGTKCTDVRLNFSKSYYSTFTYDAKKKAYLKTHTGKPHMDAAVNKQLQYTNVFILETECAPFPGSELVKLDWKGGTGYYLSYGTMREIKWHKKNYDAPIVITNKNGKEIKINRGNSYIGVVNNGSTVF